MAAILNFKYGVICCEVWTGKWRDPGLSTELDNSRGIRPCTECPSGFRTFLGFRSRSEWPRNDIQNSRHKTGKMASQADAVCTSHTMIPRKIAWRVRRKSFIFSSFSLPKNKAHAKAQQKNERHYLWRNLPWSQRLSFNIIFFHLEICDAKHWSKHRVWGKRKPLVATVANLTFMLAQHLTAVKDVIFFWPITKGDRIYNLLTGPGGSVLQYLEINYFVGRRGAFAVFTSCRTSRVLFSFLKGTNYFFDT